MKRPGDPATERSCGKGACRNEQESRRTGPGAREHRRADHEEERCEISHLRAARDAVEKRHPEPLGSAGGEREPDDSLEREERAEHDGGDAER